MANQNRRTTTRPRPQNGQRRPERRRKKRKKINWFRVAVITAALVLTVIVILSIVKAVKPAAASQGETAETEISNTQPKFFSTVRPESMETQENSEAEKPEKTEPKSKFDGVLFVGDSLTAKLQSYAEEGDGFYTILGDADFLTDSDYSWQALAQEFDGGEASLELYGQSVTLVEAIEQLGARKVYIQLGKEDLVYYQPEIDLPNMQNALTKLHAACPDVEIVVQSLTPLMQWCYRADLDNGTVETLNTEMKDFCAANGFEFLDIASALCPGGVLPEEYCADTGDLAMHMNEAGCAEWTNYLIRTVAPESVPTPTPKPETGAVGREDVGTESSTDEKSES